MEHHPDKSLWIREALSKHELPLLRYATRMTGSPDAARDVVQETFLQLCQADRSQIENHLAPWLFRVCRNRALDLRRKETRVEPLQTEQQHSLPSPAPGPAAIAENRQGASQVLRLIATLSEEQQEVVTLRFQGGLSYKEISAVTGHTVSNVGVMLHVAVKKIREHMGALAAAGTASAGGAR